MLGMTTAICFLSDYNSAIVGRIAKSNKMDLKKAR